jgi:hypothetical protein
MRAISVGQLVAGRRASCGALLDGSGAGGAVLATATTAVGDALATEATAAEGALAASLETIARAASSSCEGGPDEAQPAIVHRMKPDAARAKWIEWLMATDESMPHAAATSSS